MSAYKITYDYEVFIGDARQQLAVYVVTPDTTFRTIPTGTADDILDEDYDLYDAIIKLGRHLTDAAGITYEVEQLRELPEELEVADSLVRQINHPCMISGGSS